MDNPSPSLRPPPSQQQPATYDRLAAHYDRAMRPLERLFLASLRQATFAVLPPDSRILEIGAGTGSNFSFYPHASHYVASDVSHQMLTKAREKNLSPGVCLVQSRAEALPFADKVFDAAVATLVFCSVASPQRAFAELRRVVQAGGTIALLEHVRPEGILLGRFFDLLNKLTVPLFDDHFNRRTADEARRAGLVIQQVETRLFGIIQLIICKV